MALPPETITSIETYLNEGKLSKREISRRLGVSRVTIDRIEKRLLFPEEEKVPQIRIVHFNAGDDKLSDENRPEYARCSGCGGMQQKDVPCLVCQVRKFQTQSYDCYMEDLLTPQVFSPLSSKYTQKKVTRGKGKKRS